MKVWAEFGASDTLTITNRSIFSTATQSYFNREIQAVVNGHAIRLISPLTQNFLTSVCKGQALKQRKQHMMTISLFTAVGTLCALQ